MNSTAYRAWTVTGQRRFEAVDVAAHGGLAPRGQLVVVGAAPDPLEVGPLALVFGARIVRGNLTGTSIENEGNVRFALDHAIHSINEVYPLDDAPRAYERMAAGDARFRAVLAMGK